MATPDTGWPLLQCPRLLSLREALRKRSKAIGYKTHRWSCERIDSDDGESLIIRMNNLSFRMWSDHVLWVHADLGSNRISFHATLGLQSASELVRVAEQSLASTDERSLTTTWTRFDPYDVESKS